MGLATKSTTPYSLAFIDVYEEYVASAFGIGQEAKEAKQRSACWLLD
jgi:hypothetical protein